MLNSTLPTVVNVPQSTEISARIADPANRRFPVSELLERLAHWLDPNGETIWRISTSLRTLHPEVFVRNITYTRDKGTEVFLRKTEIKNSPTYLHSPIAKIHQGVDFIRRKLNVPDEEIEFPICRELKAQGVVDYLVMSIGFGQEDLQQRTFISYASKTGFSDEWITLLLALRPVLSLRLEIDAAEFTKTSLLEVYLGSNAAKRVARGAVTRGEGEAVNTAIFFCDLRGFTSLADQLPAQEVVSILDQYFECVGAPINTYGGDILKFIGDAILAVFPVEISEQAAALAALGAAKDGLANLEKLNNKRKDQGLTPVDIGIALHFGTVFYGNIGAANRLDFTVIGAAVNEVCRLEGLCKQVARAVVMSERFATLLPESAHKEYVGQYTLKGVQQPVQVYSV